MRGDKIRTIYNYAVDAYADAIEYSQRAVNFVNNEQWSSREKTLARKHNKPLLTYNILANIISIITGNEQLNRRRAKVKAGASDKVSYEMAAIIQGRWNLLNDEQNIEEKLQTVFQDGLISRKGGWLERRIELNDDGYLDYNYQVANNMRIYPDPEWRVADTEMKHCRWIIKESYETLDYIKDYYGVNISEDDRNWWTNLNDAIKRFKDRDYTASSGVTFDKQNDRYQLIELEERTVEKVYICTDGNAVMDILPEDFKKFKEKHPDLQVLQKREKDRIHITTIVPAFRNLEIYDKDSYLRTPNFSVFPFFSYKYNMQATEVASLVDILIDIQKDVNKGKSQMRDYATQNLSGVTYTDKREAQANQILKKRGNEPGLVVELNNLDKHLPRTTPPQQMSPDVMTNPQDSLMYADRISTINAAMRGQSERSGESGKLFDSKVERSSAAINPFLKGLSATRKCVFKDYVDNFPLVYSEANRMTRLSGADNQDVVLNLTYGNEVLNSVDNLSLYVELDEGEDNITAKEENFEKQLALTNLITSIDPAYVDVRFLVESAPIQQKEKWIEYIDNVREAQQQAQSKEDKNTDQQTDIEKINKLLENRKIEKEINKPDEQAGSKQNGKK